MNRAKDGEKKITYQNAENGDLDPLRTETQDPASRYEGHSRGGREGVMAKTEHSQKRRKGDTC